VFYFPSDMIQRIFILDKLNGNLEGQDQPQCILKLARLGSMMCYDDIIIYILLISVHNIHLQNNMHILKLYPNYSMSKNSLFLKQCKTLLE
jgi:hypothetical protein